MGFGGFSWKRALGISAAKARLSRRIGIPFTRSGRQRKLGKLVSGGGCLVALAVTVGIPLGLVALLIALWATSPGWAPTQHFGSSTRQTLLPNRLPDPR
jgi:hypothetical protein